MFLGGLNDVLRPEAEAVPGDVADGHEAFAVAVSVEDGQTLFVITQHNQRMAALGTDEGAGGLADIPGKKIVIGEIAVGSLGDIQFYGIFSGGAGAGTFSKEGEIDTVGINPAGGANIRLILAVGADIFIHAVIGYPGGAQGGFHQIGTGTVVKNVGIAVENAVELFCQGGNIGIVTAIHLFPVGDPAVF